jgi:hypothetical protein
MPSGNPASFPFLCSLKAEKIHYFSRRRKKRLSVVTQEHPAFLLISETTFLLEFRVAEAAATKNG